MNPFNFNDFIFNMSQEKFILFLGDDFNIEAPINSRILSLPWDCVLTTQRRNNFAEKFRIKGRRSPREIICINDLQGEIFHKNNIYIVKLFGSEEESADEYNYDDRAGRVAAQKLMEKILELAGVACSFVVLGLEESVNSYLNKFVTKNFIDTCINYTSLDNHGYIYLFGVNSDLKKILEEEGMFLKVKNPEKIYSIKNSLADYFGEDDIYEDDDIYEEDDEEKIYADNKVKVIEIPDVIRDFSIPLTINLMKDTVIEPYLIKNEFYRFLKDSNVKPCWYAYKNEFNLERIYEALLYHETVKNLEKPGNFRNKAICLAGQSGSGKSVAVGALAYRIFNEHKFPVVFINEKDNLFVDDHVKGKNKKIGALKEYLIKLSGLGAKSILLIWDCNAASVQIRSNVVKFFDSFRNNGFNITLVFTSYEVIENNPQEFVLIKANTIIHKEEREGEMEKLRRILRSKAKVPCAQVESIIQAVYKPSGFDGDLLYLLYVSFYEVRPGMRRGMRDEASSSITAVLDLFKEEKNQEAIGCYFQTDIAYALMKAGYRDSALTDYYQSNGQTSLWELEIGQNIKDVLISIAICTKFDVVVPSSLVYRLLTRLDYRVVRRVFQIPFFVFEEKADGDFIFCIRNKTTAKILLDSFAINPEEEIAHIAELIKKLRDDTCVNVYTEVDMMSKLLIAVGPNSGNWSSRDYGPHYKILIDALRELRSRVEIPRLLLQEMVLVREYTVQYDINNVEEIYNIIKVGEKTIGTFRDKKNSFYSTMQIELCNCKLRAIELCKFKSGEEYNGNNSLQINDCEDVIKNCEDIISRDPENTYAFSTLFRAALKYYEMLPAESVGRIEMENKFCSVIERIRGESDRLVVNTEVCEAANCLYDTLGKEDLAEEFFRELLQKQSPVGIVRKARYILQKNGINLYKKTGMPFSKEQLDKCKVVMETLLNNPDYIYITQKSDECQQMMLRLTWITYDGEPVFCGEKKLTHIPQEGWENLLQICDNYFSEIYDDNIDYYRLRTMLYVRALSNAQLKHYQEFEEKMDELKRKTSDMAFESQTKVFHILCDEKGIPLKFNGKFNNDVNKEDIKGYITVEHFHQNVYYHRHDMSLDTQMESGRLYNDFNLGLGYKGLRAFRTSRIISKNSNRG